MTLISFLGFMAGALTTVCWLPQAWRTIRSRDTASISVVFQGLMALGLALWIAYGASIQSWPLVAANALTLPPVLVILVIKILNLAKDDARR